MLELQRVSRVQLTRLTNTHSAVNASIERLQEIFDKEDAEAAAAVARAEA